ncbi:hypothetical protein BGZ63DRAFT_373464 [Mariannaea sp. PMI_226]|nr:hypothetical protein BGZ63DRAFT_373464 [Mariannaea sp. PMI_226]
MHERYTVFSILQHSSVAFVPPNNPHPSSAHTPLTTHGGIHPELGPLSWPVVEEKKKTCDLLYSRPGLDRTAREAHSTIQPCANNKCITRESESILAHS